MVPSPFLDPPPTLFNRQNNGVNNAVNFVSEGLDAQRDFILNKRFPGSIETRPVNHSRIIELTSMTEDNQTETESIGSFGTPSP